jgi:DNA-binding CsgD family transcriptional regulator
MAMRFKGTDRKAVEEHVARSPAVTDYARLYPAAARRTADIVTGLSADYEAQGITVVFETEESPEKRVARLCERFCLTVSEAQLALHIAGGHSLAAYADGRGIARTTARNQLQQVFDKTDVRRQAELVKLLSDF